MNFTHKRGIFDPVDEERKQQEEEFLKRERQQASGKPSSKAVSKKPPQKKTSKVSTKILTVEEKLELTTQWLEDTFPHLFAADDYLSLDHQLLRDLKNDYRHNQVKEKYPPDLILKAALARYKESVCYLTCLKEGTPRYNLGGEVCGYVTREEEMEAEKMLETL